MKKILIFITLILGVLLGFFGSMGYLLWVGAKVTSNAYVVAIGLFVLGVIAYPRVKELFKELNS